MEHLVRTDKNGTKYYEGTTKCSKCGGSGYIEYFSHHDGGICYNCNGTGEEGVKYKEYTPEYAAKLQDKKNKKQEEENDKIIAGVDDYNIQFMLKNDFNENGDMYIYFKDTYQLKEELKANNIKYDYLRGWHAPVQINKYPNFKININDYVEKDMYGRYCVYKEDTCDRIKDLAINAITEINKKETSSEYIGTVGDKLELTLTFQDRYYMSYENDFGSFSYFIYTFIDMDGNYFVWKATRDIFEETKEGQKLELKGTIKEHKEYKGIKKTILTRCKLVKFISDNDY